MVKQHKLLLMGGSVVALLLAGAFIFLPRLPSSSVPGPTPGKTKAPGTPRVAPPDLAFVPAFDADTMSNSDLLVHYSKQLPAAEKLTLDQWQNLLSATATGSAKPPMLPLGQNHFVMSLADDHAGNLWIGTEGEGVFRYSPGKPASEQWAQFTTKDGLGDDYGYAVAADLQGRVWVGHLNHGVSVYANGKWQNYEVVGGLSKPDSLSGPLGERIFKITVAPAGVTGSLKDPLSGTQLPVADSVWMASSAGLAIYFPSTDTWSYLTRADGLPSDQANAMAFDTDGTVFVGTQCDGICIASPADGYATWKRTTGPDEAPTVGRGSGLPTSLINDMLVAGDHTVYAATNSGLAWSTDKGGTWQFVRGADWVDKVKNRFGGPPAGWKAPPAKEDGGGILAEDYTTTLAENAEGNIMVGHRATGGDIVGPQAAQKLDSSGNDYVTSYVSIPGTRNLFRGTYGQGLSIYSLYKDDPPMFVSDKGASKQSVKLPMGALPPKVEELVKLSEKVKPQSGSSDSVAYLGQDWATHGDWMGRYGRQVGILCAANSPFNHVVSLGEPILVQESLGTVTLASDGVRNWLRGLTTDDPHSLWDPFTGCRRQAEWDDHGETYPASKQGPDIAVHIKLPEGLYRVSPYFVNVKRDGSDRFRDYLLEIKPAADSMAEVYAAAPICKSRVQNFYGGVYQQFLLSGPSDQYMLIHRSGSLNTICSGIFVDKLQGPSTFSDDMPRAMMGNLSYDRPKLPNFDRVPDSVKAAATTWNAIDGEGAGIVGPRVVAVLAYRLAAANNAPSELLDRCRWSVPLWTPADRQTFNSTMQLAFRNYLKANPQVASKLSSH